MKNGIFLKITILLFCVCIISSNCMAQQYMELPLWSDKGNEEDCNDALIKVYIPEASNGMAVIACPGGGYSYLELEKEGTKFAPFFNEQHIALIVSKYRTPNGRSDVPLADAQQAIRVVKERSEEWHIDKNKIGIMGSSAGGHLAVTLATHTEEDIRPAFQILLYPVISMKEGLTHAGSRSLLLGNNPDNKLVEYYSNELHVKPETPPAFIVVSHNDKTVSSLNSIYYYTALHQYNIPAELHIYPTGGHGWALNDNFAYKEDWSNALKKWLVNISESLK